MNPRVAAIAVMIAVLPAMAVAQPPEPSTNKRIDPRQQQQRPDRGGPSGQLKQNESARQQRSQPYVPRTQDKAVTDGKAVPRERIRTEQKQEVPTKRTHRQKQDGQGQTPR